MGYFLRKIIEDMNHKVILFCIVPLCIFNLFASGATYYIDNNTGDDSWDGKHPEFFGGDSGPWKNVEKVNSASLNPGDSVLFKRNCVWNSTINVPNHGNSSESIIFGSYGQGNKPIINGENRRLMYGILSFKSYITIRDISVRNINGQGIAFADNEGNRNILINNVEVTNTGTGNGILFNLGGENVHIKNSVIHNSANAGIALMGSKDNKLSNVIVENCDISNSGVNGITIHKTMEPELYSVGNNFIVRNNKSYNNGKRGIDITAGNNILVENNATYGNQSSGYAVDHGAHNVLFKSNISYDEGVAGYVIVDCMNVDVCFNLGFGGTKHQIVITSYEGTSNNIRIYNNTFIAGSDNLIDFDGLLGSVFVKNNIFYSPLQRNIMRFLSPLRPPNFSDFDIDHNLYFSETEDDRHFYSAQRESLFTFPAMTFSYGQDKHSGFINPIFIDSQKLNFMPSFYSGAIRRGTKIYGSPIKDFYGNCFNLQAPDAGAIQLQY